MPGLCVPALGSGRYSSDINFPEHEMRPWSEWPHESEELLVFQMASKKGQSLHRQGWAGADPRPWVLCFQTGHSVRCQSSPHPTPRIVLLNLDSKPDH